MFARKPKTVTSQATVDELNRKKLISKILDIKKEVNSRLRYLKNYIESTDSQLEIKQFFDQNYSQIYFIFYESFILVEGNLKQKINKLSREELDLVLFIFQKILVLQPERINQRWQSRSIGRLLQKLVHISNTKYLKITGLRLFLLWYQILNKNRTQLEELMFQKLIQGFDLFHSNVHTSINLEILNAEAQKVFSSHQNSTQLNSNAMLFSASNSKSTLYQFEITYLIPHSSQNEHIFMIQQPSNRDQINSQPNSQQANQNQSSQQSNTQNQIQSQLQQQSVVSLNSHLTQNQQQQQIQQQLQQHQSSNIYSLTAELLKYMVNFMQNDFLIVEWSTDRYKQSILCYEFLFDEFKRFYLSYMFPNAFIKQSSSSNLSNNVASASTSPSLNVYSNIDLLNLINNESVQQNQSLNQKQQQTQSSTSSTYHHDTRYQQYNPFHQINYQTNPPLDEKKQVQLNCKEEIIKWLIEVLLIDSSTTNTTQTTLTTSLLAMSTLMDSSVYSSIQSNELKSLDEFSCDESIDSNFTSLTSVTLTNSTLTNKTDTTQTNKQLIQKVLLSSQSNVNLVHEILRNTYFLNFDENSQTVKLVLDAYKKWFLSEAKLPAFMLEPIKYELPNKNVDFLNSGDFQEQPNDHENPVFSLNQSGENNGENENFEIEKTPSVSSSSSILSLKTTNQSDIMQQQSLTRIGSVKCLQIFYYHSYNLLLNRANLQRPDKIKNICCYLLDIYKTFIKKIQMDSYTWTMLIKILLRVCNFLFNSNSDYLSLNSTNTPGAASTTTSSNTRSGENQSTSSSISQLIKLTTETTLMAMIKATYNFSLPNDLWDQLVNLFQIVNSNHDVVDKWMESIDDLMIQIFKYIYNIDLNTIKGFMTGSNQNDDDDESDTVSSSSTNIVFSTRSNSVSSSLMDEKRKLRNKNREKQQQQQLQLQTQVLSSSSSNYLLSNTLQTEKKSLKSQNNVTYSPAVLSTVGLNKPISSQTNPIAQNVNQMAFSRQASTKHNLQNTFRDDTYLHTLANSLIPNTNDIEQSKSPSLTDENFLNLTNQQTTKPSSFNDQNSHNDETNHEQKTNEINTDTENDSSILNDPQNREHNEEDEDEENDELDDDSYEYNQYNSKYFYRGSKRRADDESYNGEDDDTTSSINETDSNDSSSYDKSATLKAANQIDQLNCYNSNTIKSNTLTNINKFSASEKSIYYSSELLVDKPNTSGSSSLNSAVTSPTLQINVANQSNSSNLEDETSSFDESNNLDSNSSNVKSNNSSFTTQNTNTPNTQTTNISCSSSSSSSSNAVNQNNNLLVNNSSSSPSIKQYSPKLGNSPNQPSLTNTSNVPPPLPPLPANLPSKFYLLNQAQLSKANQLDQILTEGLKNRKSIESESQSDSNIIQVSTSSNSSSVQASPLGKLTISLNQQTQLPSSQVEFNLSSPNRQQIKLKETKQESSKVLNKNDERSASFIMETPKMPIVQKTEQNSNKSNQSLLAISSTSSRANRQSLSIVTNNSDLAQAQVGQQDNTELDMNKKFKSTSLMLLRRLFGCMGNVNLIKDPLIHKKIFEFILYKWSKLAKVKDEMLILMTSSTNICEIIMPQSYFASWLFESIHKYLHELSASIPPSLSANYQSATLIAYKILSNIVIKSAQCSLDDPFYSISSNFIDLYYISLHYGLISNDKNILNCIIQSCSTKFWHLMLESSSLLIKDFINACLQIDNQGPKLEAISILGAFICLPDFYDETISFLSPAITTVKSSSSSSSPSITTSTTSLAIQDPILNTVQFTREEFKNLLISTLGNFELSIGSDLDNSTSMSNFNNSKCVLLCSLTCFIFDEILSTSSSKTWNLIRLNEACKKIFKDLEYRDQYSPILIKMSCDNLRFLSCLANFIFQKDIQFAINIINELNQCLVKLINNKPSSNSINENYEKAIIANMFALLEWCMNMPLAQLKDQDRATLLKNNFKLIIHISNTFKSSESIECEHIHLAAKFIISHLLNHLNHYPYGTYGPTKICSSCNETSDLTLIQAVDSKSNDSNNNNNLTDDLSILLFDQPNIQFFTVNNQFLISFVELPLKNSDLYLNETVKQNLKLSATVSRFIIRDFSGKYCWECCLLNSPNHLLPKINQLEIPIVDLDENQTEPDQPKEIFDFKNLTNFTHEEIPKNIDLLENILEYVNYSSPECRLDTLISNPSTNSATNFSNLDEIKQKIISCETESIEEKVLISDEKKIENESSPIQTNDLNHYFNLCKSFVHQMGLLSWEKRQNFNVLHKSPQLLRELKSLDDQTCRETHKIALIYIAKGQEDKQSILSNEKGSKDYHDFLSALAWPVNLETHEGFMGGLHHVSAQLKTAPYYSNSLCEVLFHVSTMMNSNDQNKISKWRHLGNDSVQIIWSEHTKDYDRSILATEFADVIICIYPLSSGLYRVQIIKKHHVGFFGPLFDGAILHKSIMPHLIRSTAINASRVLLSNTKGYQEFYVHRAHAINNIVSKLTEKQTFEQFVVDVYSPNINSKSKSEPNTNIPNVHSPVMNSSSILPAISANFDSEKQIIL
ncbi:unnamed protein product [Brachionus calyciflorus]|uniref:Rap-GAP domain-containing protein n=1 Tax=Brachionus calyciflorus TaxID=104777 RepID=A0A813UY70_9BILA|nr:unnamed protein product [Brachionus calyciflorus]